MNSLRFDISWGDSPGEDPDAGRALAWGSGVLCVEDEPVWFVGKPDAPAPVTWSWIELLEFLASRWLYLTTEQTYPHGLLTADPRGLRRQASKVYGHELPDDVDEDIFDFEGRHDLSRAVRGITLPSVSIVREGSTVRVGTDGQVVRILERKTFFAGLEKIGDDISARLETSKSERAKAAVRAWQHHNVFNVKDLVGLASGNVKFGTPSLDYWELDNEPGADSELAAVARFMAGAKTHDSDFEEIFRTIREEPPASCVRLDDLAKALEGTLNASREKDYFEQGYDLAQALTRKLDVPDDKPVDVERIILNLGVPVIETSLSPGIDAVGCWGNRHGPAIIINREGHRSGTPQGRRSTLAHELCHLLADRGTALPLAEVLGGGSPYPPERRANAFAAEFLLPRWQARVTYKKSNSLESALLTLSVRFGVGKVLAAAQLLNASNTGISQSEKAKLEKLVQDDPYTAY